MSKFFLLTAILFTSFSVQSQNGIIQGKVQDQNGIAQEFANILLLNNSDSSLVKGVVSDLDGTFLFDNVEQGTYLVAASLIGFNDAYSPAINSKNDEISIDNLILSEGIDLEEVKVVASKPFIEMKADKIIVNVENSTVNSGNSALEILEKSPGVTIDKDNNISLRGKQGVLVLIDGKNQYMSGDELSNLLESMPAANIRSIEIVTNPSSKYDAEGNSGIINIQLRKNSNLGMNGSVSVGSRQGERFSHNVGADFNYRSNKINVYGSGSRSEWAGIQDLQLMRVIPFNNGNTTFDQASAMTNDRTSYNTKLGIDYAISDNTTIGILHKLNDGDDMWINDNKTLIFGQNAPSFDILSVLGINEGNWNQNSFNFNVVHNFDDKGTTLSFDTDFSNYGRGGDNTYDNFYFDLDNTMVTDPFLLRNCQNTDINIFASKLDFTKAFESGIKLELGAKVSSVSTDNDTRFEALENESWENQENRTNNFVYDEDVIAAYANVSTNIGKFNVQAGLRMEHTVSEGNSTTLDESVPREYTNLFPSLSVSHNIGENHNLSYSYSRRLNRPNYKYLNPFVEYLDEYTFQKGNPFLNPQYSNAFGLNYGYKNKIFVSANYSHTSDAMTEVIEQFSGENQTFQTRVNLDNFNSASLTVSSSIPWKELGATRINITGFYNDFKSAIPSGTLDNQNAAYNIYIGNEINLPKDIVFELSGNYRSGLTYGLFEISSEYGIDAGLSKKIMKGKGSLKIGFDDIFRSRKDQVKIRQDDIALDVFNIHDSRRVKVNFRYKFGNNKVKSSRRRTTATAEENSRLDD